MSDDLKKRKSLRLKDYDYSQEGLYFVTVCTFNRECLCGEIIDGKMFLNENGKIAQEEWLKTPVLRPNVTLFEFVIMPNHVHGIIEICRGVLQYAPTSQFRSPSQTIGAIVRGFKSAATKRINQLRNTPGAVIWQRNYFEHVIRNDYDLHQTRQYILDNPLKWDTDRNNPKNL